MVYIVKFSVVDIVKVVGDVVYVFGGARFFCIIKFSVVKLVVKMGYGGNGCYEGKEIFVRYFCRIFSDISEFKGVLRISSVISVAFSVAITFSFTVTEGSSRFISFIIFYIRCFILVMLGRFRFGFWLLGWGGGGYRYGYVGGRFRFYGERG